MCALLLLVAFAAIRSAVRLVFALGDAVRERARCRRRGVVAGLAALAAFAVTPTGCVGPAPAMVLAIAAVDCWLALLSCGAPTVPRATVLSRSHFHPRAR